MAPLKTRVSELESQIQEIRNVAPAGRLHKMEQAIDELFLKVESLPDDAKKGE